MLASTIFFYKYHDLTERGLAGFQTENSTQGAISGQVWATGAAERMKNDPRRPVLVANLRFEGSSDAIALRSVSGHCNASF